MILEDPVEEAGRVLAAAEAAALHLRVMGGVAVNLRCPSIRTIVPPRTYRDLDLCGRSRDTRRIERLFESVGYTPSKRFNILNGGERLLFDDPRRGKHVDVFLDILRMCHDLDLRERLTADLQTLSLADLLLSKLQIVEMTERDIVDSLALLRDHPLVERQDTGINLARMQEVCGQDWGWWRTVMVNLDKLAARRDPWAGESIKRARQLEDFMVAMPKSMRWRARAAVGERKRWYELPEEVR